jgi:hypothetical protein
VAEWQTQRIQNPTEAESSRTIAHDSATLEEGISRDDRASDGLPPRSAAAYVPTVAELRGKLDAAIMAEQWEAVKAIRDRIVEVERTGNVVAIRAKRRDR